MSNKWIDKYVDEEGNVDNKLTLTSEGFACLTEDLECIVDKYTGIEDVGFMQCSEIRTNMIELIHLIFVESPIGLSILLLGIVFIGIMGYRADMQDTFSRRYEQDEKWRKDN